MATSTEAPEFRAVHRYARLTARKARLIADLIRGKSVNQALEALEFVPQRAAAFYLRVLKSAMANASLDESVDLNALVVAECRADDGPLLNNRMRWRPGPQGRAMPFRKRTSHLTVVLREAEAEPVERVEEKPKAAKKATKKKAAKKSTKKSGNDEASAKADEEN